MTFFSQRALRKPYGVSEALSLINCAFRSERAGARRRNDANFVPNSCENFAKNSGISARLEQKKCLHSASVRCENLVTCASARPLAPLPFRCFFFDRANDLSVWGALLVLSLFRRTYVQSLSLHFLKEKECVFASFREIISICSEKVKKIEVKKVFSIFAKIKI